MKAIQKVFCSIVLVAMIAGSDSSTAQDNKTDKSIQVQDKLISKKFVFVAQSVTPSRGGFRPLTSTYDLKISNDSLVCNLPYFGRAYTAANDASSGGFNFTSTSFDYKVTPRKKNGWDINIKPTDYKDVQQLFLNVFTNGSATLMITSNSRQPITFNGNVR